MAKVNKSSKLKALLFGPSILAMGVALTPSIGLAQTAPQSTSSSSSTDATSDKTKGTVKEVVVTGVRASLKTAQGIKRNADTVVDSITATDIGQFPDKSVAEALQRVAGITVNRFAASSDTAHFSAEPSGVLVRGLTQVRSEFNGRDSFSANSSRGLDWGDISPELMAGVDSYKNATAELIEGGIAGSINMRTRVPFDSPGQVISISADANYGDLSRKTTPDFSGIYSNRWQTPIGEFGLMVDGAYSKVQTISQGIQYGRTGAWQGVFAGQGNTIDYIPASMSLRDSVYDRDRKGVAIAGQWRSPDHKFLLTAQYNESSYSNVWHEHAVQTDFADFNYGHCAHAIFVPGSKAVNPNTDANGCEIGGPTYYSADSVAPTLTQVGSTPIFNSAGQFQSGMITDQIGWWGSSNTASGQYAQNSSGQNMVNACYGWNGCSPAYRAPDFGTATRMNENREFTADSSINLKWDPTDRLHFNFDLQQVHSSVKNYDIEVDQNSWANVSLDTTGSMPKMTLSTPLNINQDAGGLSTASNYYYRAVMDHLENSGGDELAARADLRWDIKSGWLDSLKVGYRHADREQTVRWSGYNWANIANEWTGCNQYQYFNISNHNPTTLNSGCSASGTFAGYPQNNTALWSFPSNFMGGGITNVNTFTFANFNLIKNQRTLAKALGAPSLGVGSWDPLCSNTGARSSEIKGTCFTQAETDKVGEITDAAYVMLKFGGPDLKAGRFPISGNIGVRYVRTDDESSGGASIKAFGATDLACQAYTLPAGAPAGTPFVPQTAGCYLSAADKAFANGANLPSKVSDNFGDVLPSFNVKMDLNSQWLVRFAASRAMSRPDVGLLKNYLGVGYSLPSPSNPSDPRWIKDSSGNVTGVTPSYSGSAYNPMLKPTMADQLDFSIEHYFGNPGSLTIDFFYKKFHDYIQYGAFNANITNNGVTRTSEFTGPENMDGGRIKGFEAAYQRFFTFLPGPLSGLGVQTNFTYVDQHGVNNSHLSIVSQPGITNSGVPDTIKVNSLEGMSKYSANVIGMYEKGPWSARLAYSWRDKWLVTALDCCVYLPVWQMSSGFLDGSVHYKMSEHIEFDFAATNILNTATVLKQQVTDSDKGGLLQPNAWFQNDRRFQLGVRLKY